MELPMEPGVYSDVRGDLWMLHEDGRWEHKQRRMNHGPPWPVQWNAPQLISAEVMAQAVDVLPLTRVEVDVPTDL